MAEKLEFWFEFGSTYSYLSIMRLEKLVEQAGVTVDWKPFLLGPIFSENGWQTSPFNIYPSKGQNMWRDMERRAARYDLPFGRLPSDGEGAFPQNGLHAARLAMIGLSKAWGRNYCKSVFSAQFSDAQNIGDIKIVNSLARQAGATEQDLRSATSAENKLALRAQTEHAMQRGIFGAPSFFVGNELFWGDDRLEDALDFAQKLP